MGVGTDEFGGDIDREAVRRKYAEERDKRMGRGRAEYIGARGDYAGFAEDPWSAPPVQRDPVLDEVEVTVIGGGLSGIMSAWYLAEEGVTDVRVVEKGSEFGGTWYWNRYPGAMCDIESYIYLPVLEEMGYVPTQKYAFGDEIRAYLQAIAERLGIEERALFQTSVTAVVWQEEASRWLVTTDRGDAFRARFVVLANGSPLSRPKLPGIPGITDFGGTVFHTARWDYEYTGGSIRGGLDRLGDKTIAVIGTGATGVQAIPHLAAGARHLVVFQRTPSAVDVRDNRPTDPEWAAALAPGWQSDRMRNYTTVVGGEELERDLVADGWTSMYTTLTRNAVDRKARELGRDLTLRERRDIVRTADLVAMRNIRERIDAEVRDPATAEALKPWYGRWCKRPCFHDEFLPVFNRQNVTLVDTDGAGVERITESGVVACGVEYPVDGIVFATGFESGGNNTHRFGYEVVGRGGQTLARHWENGPRTLHGIQAHQFPNAFMVSQTHTGFVPNYTQTVVELTRHLAYIIGTVHETGETVELTADGEQGWVDEVNGTAHRGRHYYAECTPGFFTDEGNIDNPNGFWQTNYGPGAVRFFDVLAEWRAAGDLPGVERTPPA